MYFELLIVLALQSIGRVASDPYTTLTNVTGDIEIDSAAGDHVYKIRVAKGNRIIISVSELELNEQGYLQLRDGIGGKDRFLKQYGSMIFETKKSSGGFVASVRLPFLMETETRKLIIKFHSGDEDRFAAHYTGYNANQGCPNLALIPSEETHPISLKVCDVDELSPVASKCTVTLECGQYHVQYNKNLSCVNQEWEGNIDCRPKADLIEDCVFDFDNVTADESNPCPYSPAEIARYYLDIENVDVGERQTLGRSVQNKIVCNRVCAVYRSGAYVINCNIRAGKQRHVRCLICRRIHSCNIGVVFFS